MKYHKHTDEKLMQLLQRGKNAAFEELYRRYGRRVYAYFYKMLWQNAPKANDFTQDLFLKIIEKAHTFDATKRFSTWIFTIAYNLCKNEYRKQENQKNAYQQHIYTQNTTTSTQLQLDKNTFEKDLNRALEQLSPLLRTCFILRYKEELSIKEIAAIVNCPEGTVKSRLFAATRKLNKTLQHWEGVAGNW